MKKIFLTLAVFVMAICANAQKNQYFWYNGNLMMGNPIAQIDSVTFGEGEPVDTLHIMLPRTIIKTVHDTLYITVHDTIKAYSEEGKTLYKGHEYVDLGLPSGLLWATCNVGADVPEQIGGYYSWGETQTKTSYTLDDYLYKNNPITLSDISGTQYDAATANWGAEWRMPTKQECNELISYCTIKDTTINNVIGKLVIGTNNNRIFVPASGLYAEKLYYCQSEGSESFWTSTSCGSSDAYRMWEWSYISFSEREQGFQIRPVVSATADVISQTETIPGAQIVHDTVYITIHDTVCPGENMYKGHEYVDLGLPSGLLWATCNLEAPAPEQPGGDFAWGEIASRDASSFSSSSYLYANNPIQLNDIGGIEYDAATMKWGAEWRMPTYDEIWELMSNTTLSSDVINGYNVLVFTAQNGKSMILPKNAFDNTWGGFYSSTSAGANTAYRGWEFDKGYISYNWRWEGSQIRPVVSGSVINQ